MPKDIQSFEEFKNIINGDRPVIIDFWATWCGPCKMIAPHFKKSSEKFTDIDFYKVDIEDQEEIASECGIKAMPTFQIFYKGTKIDTVSGAAPPKLTAALNGVSDKIAQLGGGSKEEQAEPAVQEETPAAN
ncbi:Thioredoxin [Phaffia rhodozyma]|uniref:Thioredoxin n=1 Tax=Phaffia rhodozyma TaxID=264483 RepID=A0A0F7SV42_PHARH|nr:Thioredoxin [Phaffia rhodozyma]